MPIPTSELTRITAGRPLLVGSQCPGSVRVWAAMLRAGTVLVDAAECHLPLRHGHHRCLIDGPNGVQRLSVPLVATTCAMPVPMSQVRISEHGRWRHLHWGALFAAYGKTPYYDYFAPLLRPLLMGSESSLLAFNTALQRLIAHFMELPITFTVVEADEALSARCTDVRRLAELKHGDRLACVANVPYYQQWASRHGFTLGLSILDLLMNCGKEGIYTLLEMVKC